MKDEIKKKNTKKHVDINPELEEKFYYLQSDEDWEIEPESELEIDEALDRQQRRKRSIIMRRLRSKIAAARKRLSKRPASRERLKQRSVRAARNVLKKRLSGGKSYDSMSPTEKAVVDKKLKKKRAIVATLAKRLLPKVREKDRARLAKKSVSESDNLDVLSFIHEVYESDINDRFSMMIESGAGFEGTNRLTRNYKKDTPGEDNETCNLVGRTQIKTFEKLLNDLFDKFGIDFAFTKHFHERLNSDRNIPCISLADLSNFMKKIYKRQGKSLKNVVGAQTVIKEIQSNLNIPVVVQYNQRKDEFDVVMKTIMRKKTSKHLTEL